VCAAIRTTLRDLAPLQVQLRHVKGHQDQQKRHSRLPLPAILNIECDKRASEYLITARRTKPQPNLPIPQSYPLLKIAGQIIVRNIQSSLRDAASTPDYHKYLQKKLKWTDRDCENANWISLKMAIQKFERNDQQRLQKFLHDWLPLRASPHMFQPASDRSCPVCQQDNEDLWHFLECQHLARHPAYQQMHTALQDLHRRHHVDPHMMQMLWQGIDSIHNQYTIDDQHDSYPTTFQNMFDEQRSIGWEQLFYGRMATSWAYFIDHSTQYKTNGTIFYSQITVCIWKYILGSWTIHNAALHPENLNRQTIQSLAPQVHHLFSIIANDQELQEYAP